MIASPAPAPVRQWCSPQPGDTWEKIAGRVLPDKTLGEAVDALQSWNLHIFLRPPPVGMSCSDVLFTEPPRAAANG